MASSRNFFPKLPWLHTCSLFGGWGVNFSLKSLYYLQGRVESTGMVGTSMSDDGGLTSPSYDESIPTSWPTTIHINSLSTSIPLFFFNFPVSLTKLTWTA